MVLVLITCEKLSICCFSLAPIFEVREIDDRDSVIASLLLHVPHLAPGLCLLVKLQDRVHMPIPDVSSCNARGLWRRQKCV